MSNSPKRFFKIAGIILLILIALISVAGFWVTGRIEQKLDASLSKAGLQVKKARISLWNRSVELNDVTYLPADSIGTYPHQLSVRYLSVEGVHILHFLRKHELVINRLIVDEGTLGYNKNFKFKKDTTSAHQDSGPEITGIRIRNIMITKIAASVMNDSLTETSATLHDLEIKDTHVSFGRDTTYSVGDVKATVNNFTSSRKGSLHTFSLSSASYNSRDEQIEADMFRITPKHSKTDFARIAKIQKTRLEVELPKIVLEGVALEKLITDRVLRAKRVIIPKPVVHAYRDKNYPFVRDWIMPLPIEGIRRLPFAIDIDSILIYQADIAYEEFSEKGLPQPGTITFNKLDASFADLNTASKKPGRKEFCTLVADCQVMNSGALHATFRFPLNSQTNYQAFGSVRNMNLKSLNPSLGNLTRFEIADGTLNELYFNFSYNDEVSTGEVLINYKDLKLQALKKDKNYHETNKLLTAAINAIIKSDKDKSVDKSKRTGFIDIERDKKRFVFQLWWKSVLDGLQSTFLNNGKKKKTRKRSS